MSSSAATGNGGSSPQAAQSTDARLEALIARINGKSATSPQREPDSGSDSARSAKANASGPAERPQAATEVAAPPRPASAPQAAAGPAARPAPAAPPRAAAGESLDEVLDRLGLPRKESSSGNDSGAPRDYHPPAGSQTRPTRSRSGAAGLDAAENPRDETWRPEEPGSLRDAGLRDTTVEEIILRFLFARGECEGRQISSQLQLPHRLIEPLLGRMKADHLIAYRDATAASDYVYVLTEVGRERARRASAGCTYYGAAPVALDDYIASVRCQTIEGQQVTADDLKRAFSDLLISPSMLARLGPAVNSGRGMFLFGYPGNGKTSIAERVTQAFGKYVWIPRSIEIDGEIMRIYDPMNHETAMPESRGGLLDDAAFDKRWVRIKRPTIVAGGELTMDMLEVRRNGESGISEAPLQLKSNCGTLVIDDFGRQKMSVDQLLNRWIVPLEKRFDYLNMSSGKKIQVPFDQLVIFSTNLEPKDLVDDAFLRRIPYKIEVPNPAEADFRKLFEIMCKVTKIPYRAEPIDYLIKKHYLPVERPFRNCQPRDLLLQVRNYCLYHDLQVELKNEYFDFAVENYFSIM